MHYKITATRLLEAKCEVHGVCSINCVCRNVLYSRLVYLFNCGKNKEPNINNFGKIFFFIVVIVILSQNYYCEAEV